MSDCPVSRSRGARYLSHGAVLAAGATPLRALVQGVQGRLPLFELQGLDLRLELVELLLQVLALLHVLHSAAEGTVCQGSGRQGVRSGPRCSRPPGGSARDVGPEAWGSRLSLGTRGCGSSGQLLSWSNLFPCP